MRNSSVFWTVVVSLSLAAGSLSLALAQQKPAGNSDPKAVAIADQVMKAMGGQANWDNTRHLRFMFFGNRTHYWDKWTGRYRLEGKTREGQPYVVLMNLNTKEGQAYLDGKPVEGEALKERLKGAYGAWVNDTYWLLMPYKLKDPGVILAYDGQEKVGEIVYDKLHLHFENVGLTPGDQYWAYINPKTHLMDKWIFLLQGTNEKGEHFRGEYRWNNWQRYGNIMLSPEREGMDGQKRMMDNVAVYDTLPDEAFTSPAPVKMP